MSTPDRAIDLSVFFAYSALYKCCKKGKCNMRRAATSLAFSQLESTILLQIENVTGQIRELMHQKHSLEQVLVRARQQSELVRRTDVTRKNSINRVLVEGSIRKSLQDAKEPVRTKTLYQNARLMVPALRENTFRSHLFRMQKRGLLTRCGYGKWLFGIKQHVKQA